MAGWARTERNSLNGLGYRARQLSQPNNSIQLTALRAAADSEGVGRKGRHDRVASCGYITGMTSVTQLLQEAAQLPEDQRLTLVHRLLVAGEPPPSDEVEQAWDGEIRERIARYDRGETRSRPAGEVFSDLDRRLQ